MISIGSRVPDFTLEDDQGNKVTLSDLRGKKVLLSWHPLAFTSVCTDQMRALDANRDKFASLNTVALGMSVDPQPAKAAWAKVLCLKDTRLLSDFWPHGKVAQDYGLFREEQGFSERANVLIDEAGKVIWIKIYEIPELPDIEEVLAKVRGK